MSSYISVGSLLSIVTGRRLLAAVGNTRPDEKSEKRVSYLCPRRSVGYLPPADRLSFLAADHQLKKIRVPLFSRGVVTGRTLSLNSCRRGHVTKPWAACFHPQLTER